MKKRVIGFAAFFFLMMACGGMAIAGTSCEDLVDTPYGGAIITSAEIVIDDGGYCMVKATFGVNTDIEVHLPDKWNNGFIHLGGGGFDGYIPGPDYNQLQMGYVLAASNGGHRSSEYPGDSFGYDPMMAQDYAYAAIGTTMRVAKSLIKAYYGMRPKYSYFVGASNGGRGAFNAAAKYLTEYDGVVAGCPTRNMAGMVAGGHVGNLSAVDLTPAKQNTIYNAALSACDALDNLEDGIISNPDMCDFDPASIQCSAGVSNDDSCLTEYEVGIVNRILNDVELSDGKLIYSKYGFGHLHWGTWGGYESLGVGHLRSMVYGDEDYDPATFNLDNDYAYIKEVIDVAYDFSADTKQLADYLRSGGKMIVWHGTDDTLLSHYDTIRSFSEMEKKAGKMSSKNAKLYMLPGVNHDPSGPGPGNIDTISAITHWVEDGIVPNNILASGIDVETDEEFTRPLCEYPMYPQYIGHGDPNDAVNFRCRYPKNGKVKKHKKYKKR